MAKRTGIEPIVNEAESFEKKANVSESRFFIYIYIYILVFVFVFVFLFSF